MTGFFGHCKICGSMIIEENWNTISNEDMKICGDCRLRKGGILI